MRQRLIIAGTGGFARETAALVDSLNAHHETWDLVGFVDDNPALAGSTVSGRPVLGPVDAVRDRDAAVVICIGNPHNYFSRRRIVERLALDPNRYATLVHPTAVIGGSSTLGPGTVVHALTVLTTDVHVGAHVTMMPGIVLTHDDIVDDYVTMGAGVRVAGGVHVRTGAYVGSGSLIRESLCIGEWSMIGMGAVVTHPVPAAQIWIGAPARYMRDVAVPSEFAGVVPV